MIFSERLVDISNKNGSGISLFVLVINTEGASLSLFHFFQSDKYLNQKHSWYKIVFQIISGVHHKMNKGV